MDDWYNTTAEEDDKVAKKAFDNAVAVLKGVDWEKLDLKDLTKKIIESVVAAKEIVSEENKKLKERKKPQKTYGHDIDWMHLMSSAVLQTSLFKNKGEGYPYAKASMAIVPLMQAYLLMEQRAYLGSLSECEPFSIESYAEETLEVLE